MKIKSIHIYSHDAQVRSINFKTNGLNIITGLSSTGKSSIINIIEYCSGKSDCLIAEGVITSKVSWVSVIYEFDNQDILVAKRLPEKGKSSCSQLMLKRGVGLSVCEFYELENNSNDETIILLFNNLLGIPKEVTFVNFDQSRNSFSFNFSHTKFYLFQPQSLIANKDSLFYRQSESSYVSQAIKDTFPILVKAESLEYRSIYEKIRDLTREINITQKKIGNQTDGQNFQVLNQLKLEANNLNIASEKSDTPEDLLRLSYNRIQDSKTKNEFNNELSKNIIDTQRSIISLRNKKNNLLKEKYLIEKYFSEKDSYFENQKILNNRLSASNAFNELRSSNSSEFNEIIDLVKIDLSKIKSKLDLYSETNDKNNKDKTNRDMDNLINSIDTQIKLLNINLESMNEANNIYLHDPFELANLYILIGKIKSFIENINIKSTQNLQEELISKRLQLSDLKKQISEYDSISEKLDSITFQISLKITEYLKSLNYEHGTSTTRFDLKNLTLITTKSSGQSIPMNKIGSGANHLALHISSILAFHYYFQQSNCPTPSFLVFDQPSQVYFPQLGVENTSNWQNDSRYNHDDIQAVKNLFKFLILYLEKEAPSLQIIVTEHALFNEPWFTDCMIEPFWAPPYALVPENWPTL